MAGGSPLAAAAFAQHTTSISATTKQEQQIPAFGKRRAYGGQASCGCPPSGRPRKGDGNSKGKRQQRDDVERKERACDPPN